MSRTLLTTQININTSQEMHHSPLHSPPSTPSKQPLPASEEDEQFNVDHLDETIGIFVQHGDLLDLNSLYDIAEEFSAAGNAIALQKRPRDSDDSGSESSSSESGVFCRACRAKRQKMGPTSIQDPETLRLGTALVKEIRLLTEVRNEQLRLVCLSDLMDKRLDEFVKLKFTVPHRSKKSRSKKTLHSTPPPIAGPAPTPTPVPSLSNSPPILRRSSRIALQHASNK
ncbi:hypothetical protein MVEG_06098 [Podila verticillata NRRL 6337]|nr:hypothetical protein MVEG_06098 [Podila verticillata NRRL 6337]